MKRNLSMFKNHLKCILNVIICAGYFRLGIVDISYTTLAEGLREWLDVYKSYGVFSVKNIQKNGLKLSEFSQWSTETWFTTLVVMRFVFVIHSSCQGKMYTVPMMYYALRYFKMLFNKTTKHITFGTPLVISEHLLTYVVTERMLIDNVCKVHIFSFLVLC